MATIHFRKFLKLVEGAYGKIGPRKALFLQLQLARLTQDSASMRFMDLLEDVKAFAVASSKVDGPPYHFDDMDSDLLTSFRKNKGSRSKAAAFHYYFLSHPEVFGACADTLNKEIDLPTLMGEEYTSADFNFRIGADPAGLAVPSVNKGVVETATESSFALKEGAEHQVQTQQLSSLPLQTSPQPWLNFPNVLQVDQADIFSEANWLNPLAVSIPFQGMEAELAELDDFFDRPGKFLVWGIDGRSGIGKTRVAIQWLRSLRARSSVQPEQILNIGFLSHISTRTWKGDLGWQNWMPDRTTVIVADDLHNTTATLLNVLERLTSLLETGRALQKVRILLVDRTLNDLRFMLTERIDRAAKPVTYNLLPSMLHKRYALNLREPDNLSLRKIIEVSAGPQDDDRAAESIKKLRGLGAAIPVFAALEGKLIANEFTDRHDSARQLVATYLNNERRLPWKSQNSQNLNDLGYWASCLVCIATITGQSLSGAEAARLIPKRLRSRWKQVVDCCSWITGFQVSLEISPLRPAVLGEAFTPLLITEGISTHGRLDLPVMLNKVINSDKSGGLATGMFRYIDTALANACLEGANSLPEVLSYVATLLDSKHYTSGSLARSATSLSLMETVAALLQVQDPDFGKIPGYAQSVRTLNDKIDLLSVADALRTPLFRTALRSLGLYHMMMEVADSRPYTTNFVRKYIEPATEYGNNTGEAPGWSPVHAAVYSGWGAFVAASLDLHPNCANTTDAAGLTPLLLAIRDKQIDSVRALLACEQVDLGETGDHFSPLGAAVAVDSPEILGLLLRDARVDPNYVDGDIPPVLLAIAAEADKALLVLIGDERVANTDTDSLEEIRKIVAHLRDEGKRSDPDA